jgi:nucleotide-binding universal stress UspA family protein
VTDPAPLFTRIVVPTDFSAESERAWSTARRLAQSLGAELVVVHVLVEAPLYSERPFAAERVREVYATARAWGEQKLREWVGDAQAAGLRARSVLRSGTPHREILSVATDERADLVVIGTHGRGGFERAMLGSVADRVIRLAPCPVLAVRETT